MTGGSGVRSGSRGGQSEGRRATISSALELEGTVSHEGDLTNFITKNLEQKIKMSSKPSLDCSDCEYAPPANSTALKECMKKWHSFCSFNVVSPSPDSFNIIKWTRIYFSRRAQLVFLLGWPVLFLNWRHCLSVHLFFVVVVYLKCRRNIGVVMCYSMHRDEDDAHGAFITVL